jgi:tetratricopeptide (TPR) repeat protein
MHVEELAHHFFQSGTTDKAIEYCARAGDRAIDKVGYEEAAEWYGRALQLADGLDADADETRAKRCDLYEKRARAYYRTNTIDRALADLDAALALAASDERKAELLAQRSSAAQNIFDIPAVARSTAELLRLAEPLGRDDLVAAGMAWRAVTLIASADVTGAIADFERAVSRGGIAAPALIALGHYPLALYWVGRYEEAIEASDRVLAASRRVNDAPSTMMTMPHRALSCASLGRYAEAIATFDEGRALGERHGHQVFMARMISMRGGTYLGLLDYEEAEVLAEEACALGRANSFMPPLVSSSLDLATIAVVRNDLARARRIVEEISKTVETAGAWHGWVWRMRLDEVNADIALAAGEHAGAIETATRALDRASACGRHRYRVRSRCIRARAASALGRDANANEDLDAALADARAAKEPALILHAMRTSLALRHDEALASEARTLVRTLAASHPDAKTRERLLERANV